MKFLCNFYKRNFLKILLVIPINALGKNSTQVFCKSYKGISYRFYSFVPININSVVWYLGCVSFHIIVSAQVIYSAICSRLILTDDQITYLIIYLFIVYRSVQPVRVLKVAVPIRNWPSGPRPRHYFKLWVTPGPLCNLANQLWKLQSLMGQQHPPAQGYIYIRFALILQVV